MMDAVEQDCSEVRQRKPSKDPGKSGVFQSTSNCSDEGIRQGFLDDPVFKGEAGSMRRRFKDNPDPRKLRWAGCLPVSVVEVYRPTECFEVGDLWLANINLKLAGAAQFADRSIQMGFTLTRQDRQS